MNIQEAKTEICNTLRAYLAKDENGYYTYPLIRQRPLLLIGPPGIGKTAIMEQAAAECGVGLVAYTITHHTRQSAIGLPEIVKRNYGGKGMMVTDYTMSEIVASVYDCMENTGRKEGILFIDEINCVSETLAPAMLALLQNKTFGSHKIPEGWILVAAGNPPEYNKSVREFDIVTLDRVRKLTIEPDCDIWLKYAGQQKVHQAIISYLSVKKNNFYAVENTVDGKFFVTARGWEDLSRLLQSYEKLGIGISEELVEEFLQKEETARDFAGFYQLYTKYGEDYENSLQIKVKMELISVREQKYQETAIRRLREYILTAKKEHVRSAENGFKRISKCFEKEAVCREDMIQKLQGELQNAFSFIKESFGENQEMLLFVTGITTDKSMTSFIAGNGCPAYFEHSEMLLYNKEENELRKACLEAVHERLQEESRDRV